MNWRLDVFATWRVGMSSLVRLNDAVRLRRTGVIVEGMCAGGEDDEAPELPARRVVVGRKRGEK